MIEVGSKVRLIESEYFNMAKELGLGKDFQVVAPGAIAYVQSMCHEGVMLSNAPKTKLAEHSTDDQDGPLIEYHWFFAACQFEEVTDA